jgi:hypothetical protein
MLALSHLSRAHQAVVGIAARKAVGRGKDSPAFPMGATADLGKSFACNSLRNNVGARRLARRAAQKGRNAIERQRGRCYTPAALKVAATTPPCLE